MAKRQRGGGHGGGHGNSERWLLTYADLITLLVVFFIVMYSMSLTDQRKFIQVADGLQKAFNVGVLDGGGSILPGSGVGISDGQFISPSERRDYQQITERITTLATANQLDGDLQVLTNEEGIVIRMAGSLLFASGRADLRPDASRVLDAVAAAVRGLPNQLRIEGHTDDLAPNIPEYPTNMDLSTARAMAVHRYLTNAASVPAARLAVAGYGEFRPLVPNTDVANRMKNRRADLVILYNPTPAKAPAGQPISAETKP